MRWTSEESPVIWTDSRKKRNDLTKFASTEESRHSGRPTESPSRENHSEDTQKADSNRDLNPEKSEQWTPKTSPVTTVTRKATIPRIADSPRRRMTVGRRLRMGNGRRNQKTRGKLT